MKKAVLSSLALFLGASAWAQITITRSDFGTIGDKVYRAHDTLVASTVSPGAAGANQTWDFSTVITPRFYDSTMFTDPSSDPKAPVGSNMRMISGADTTYMIVNTNFARLLQPVPSPFTGVVNLQIMQFPTTYLTEFNDSTQLTVQGKPADFGFPPLIDSIRFEVNAHINVKCDGWGTLTTPAASAAALRTKNTINNHVDIWAKALITGVWSLMQSQHNTSVNYNWLAAGAKAPMAEASTDSTGAITSFSYIVTSVPTGVATVAGSEERIGLYPNPASTELNILVPVDVKGDLHADLFDMNGRLIRSSVVNASSSRIDISGLSKGVYFCKVQGEDFAASRKVVIE